MKKIGSSFLSLIVALLLITACGDANDSFELNLHDTSNLDQKWEVSAGHSIIKSVSDEAYTNVVIALRSNSMHSSENMVDNVYVLQRNEGVAEPIDLVLEDVVIYHQKAGTVLLVSTTEPFVMHLSLGGDRGYDTSDLLTEIGWSAAVQPDITKLEGFGVGGHRNLEGFQLGIDESAGKEGEESLWERFAPCSASGEVQVGKGSEIMRPDRCWDSEALAYSGQQCTSGGDEAVSCSVSNGSQSCSVGCHGDGESSDACCDSVTANCTCCQIGPGAE